MLPETSHSLHEHSRQRLSTEDFRFSISKLWQLSLVEGIAHVQTALTIAVGLRGEPQSFLLVLSVADRPHIVWKEHQEPEWSFILNGSTPTKGLGLLSTEFVKKGERTSVMCVMLVNCAIRVHSELVCKQDCPPQPHPYWTGLLTLILTGLFSCIKYPPKPFVCRWPALIPHAMGRREPQNSPRVNHYITELKGEPFPTEDTMV